MLSKKVEFEKSISRDWTVLFCQFWHRSYTTQFEKQYGWGHTDALLEGENNAVTVYHPQIERYVSLRDFIISKISADDQWLINIVKKLRSEVSEFLTWCAENKKSGAKGKSDQEMLLLVKGFSDRLDKIGPAFLLDLSFPFQMENHPDVAKYKQSIDEAILGRNEVEKMAPIANVFSLFLGEEAVRRGKLGDDSLKKYLSYEEMKAVFSGKFVDKKEITKRKKYFLVSRDGLGTERIDKFVVKKGWVLKKSRLMRQRR